MKSSNGTWERSQKRSHIGEVNSIVVSTSAGARCKPVSKQDGSCPETLLSSSINFRSVMLIVARIGLKRNLFAKWGMSADRAHSLSSKTLPHHTLCCNQQMLEVSGPHRRIWIIVFMEDWKLWVERRYARIGLLCAIHCNNRRQEFHCV